MQKKLSLVLSLLLTVTGLFYTAIPAMAAEFSADFTMTDAKGKVATGKIYIKGDKIRQEIEAEGQANITILRLDKKISWTLLPENQYMEFALQDIPTQLQKDEEYETTSLGRETVNGYDCQVTQYTYKNKKAGILVYWVCQNFGYPVKIQTKDAKGKITSITEYKNIKTEGLADSLFEVPAGYEKMGFSLKSLGL